MFPPNFPGREISSFLWCGKIISLVICKIGLSSALCEGQYAFEIVFCIVSLLSVTEIFEPGLEEDIFSPGPLSEVMSGVWMATKL